VDDKNNIPKVVSIDDITISNMYEIEAIIRVLEKKEVLTHQEVLEELKVIKENQSKKSDHA